MFHRVLTDSREYYTFWKYASKAAGCKWSCPPQSAVDDMVTGPECFQWVANLALIFVSQKAKCAACRSIGGGDGGGEAGGGKGKEKERSRHSAPKIHHEGTRSGPPPRGKFRPCSPLPLYEPGETMAPSLETSGALNFDGYDDYAGTPLWSDRTMHQTLNSWTFSSSGSLVVPSFWDTWRDFGFRLPPDFFKLSPKPIPTGGVFRLLPTTADGHRQSPDQLHDSGPQPLPSEPDTKGDGGPGYQSPAARLSAAAMLDEAGPTPKTPESFDVFVRGKSRGKDFIQLCLEKDGVPLQPQEISTSVDIDSVIWVTRDLNCRGAMNLHLTPYAGDRAPISSNPGVYVHLLFAPEGESEMNPEKRQRARFPLSSIPHVPFGHFGEGLQQFNANIFFPRMMHRNTNNNLPITLLPRELQNLWLSAAIFPACRCAMERYPGTSEYLPHSMEQMRWKGGDRARQPTVPVRPEVLGDIIGNLKSIIAAEDDLLSRFGSFFFVLDARGVKLLSKQRSPGETAFEALRDLVPALDWDRMLKDGELYLDLGVSYHPKCAAPMVGLWRLENLIESYALMGCAAKNELVYHHGSMRDYGGAGAEMDDDVRRHTHLVKRISYNLNFEAVRQPGQKDYISTLDDAIRTNEKYMGACKRWMQLFKEAEDHPYGVRDEIRGSGRAIIRLLDVAMDRVSTALLQPMHSHVAQLPSRQRDTSARIPSSGCHRGPSSDFRRDALLSCMMLT